MTANENNVSRTNHGVYTAHHLIRMVPNPKLRPILFGIMYSVTCAQWGCGYVYGFRVPLIVISPYVRANFISKQQHDFGSILKFIEITFSLPSLRYADVPADDFSDCFNFNQTPLTFKTIQAPFNAQYFLNDKTPPTDPDDD